MCVKLTVDLALERVREGVAGREEADYLQAMIDGLKRAYMKAACTKVEITIEPDTKQLQESQCEIMQLRGQVTRLSYILHGLGIDAFYHFGDTAETLDHGG